MYNNLGIALEELGRTQDAAVAYKLAVEHQRIAFTAANDVARYRSFLSKHYFNYGRVLRQLGYPDQAVRAALARRDLWLDAPERLFAIAEELAIAGAPYRLQAGRKSPPISVRPWPLKHSNVRWRAAGSHQLTCGKTNRSFH